MNQRNNHILVIGAGEMAKAIVYDLLNYDPRYTVTVVDNSLDALNRLTEFVGIEGVSTIHMNAKDSDQVESLMSEAIVVIGAAGYMYNVELTRLAIKSGASWIDLGGNNSVVEDQFLLSDDAVNAGVTVVPDCGLAPGMVSVLAGDARTRMNKIDSLHFRVGGLPINPKPPLDYGLLFSPDGLANEYSEPCRVIENGKICEVEPLTGLEEVDFGAPYGKLESFHTSGGSSTMIDSFAGKVESLDYKTLRYPGHLKKIRLLYELGLFDVNPVTLNNNTKVTPRELLCILFVERLGWIKEDVSLLMGLAQGEKDGKKIKIKYQLIDQFDPKTGLTSMARTTGFSAVVIARMIADGRIKDKGVLRQELSVPSGEYIRELKLRDIQIEIREC